MDSGDFTVSDRKQLRHPSGTKYYSPQFIKDINRDPYTIRSADLRTLNDTPADSGMTIPDDLEQQIRSYRGWDQCI